MSLILACVFFAAVLGYLMGGRLANISGGSIRWFFLAPVGLALELVPAPGRILPFVLMFLSFLVLAVLAVANIRTPGFPLILLGLALNILVIAVNGGMPVTRHALMASGQQDSISLLIHHGGGRHHLASPSDVLLPLADVIPVRWFAQVLSAGDVATYAGIMWVLVAGMKGRWHRSGAQQPAGQATPTGAVIGAF